MSFQVKHDNVEYEVPRSLDPDVLWEHMCKFLHRGTLTLKNFENGLACESWDAMYHTGHFLSIAAMRLRRTGDLSIIPIITQILDTILEQGINFRGFNGPGEYWRDYLLHKYYPQWGKEEVFRDTSRDQILCMNVGLFFLYEMLKADPSKYGVILEKTEQIANLAQKTLHEHDYDLGTTYGDCRTYQMPFDLCYNVINGINSPKEKIRATTSENYFKWIGWAVPIVWKIPRIKERQYFTIELTMQTLFLVANAFREGNYGIYPEKVKKRAIKSMEHLVKRFRVDENLYFQLLYHFTTGTSLFPTNYRAKLEEIFQGFDVNEPKKQDFVWQRHPKYRYFPREEWKGYYAPYHDYLIVYELLEYLGL